MQVALEDLVRAREARDPALAQLLLTLAQSDAAAQRDLDESETQDAQRQQDQSLLQYFKTIDSREFAALPPLEQARYRVQQFRHIEASEENPERYRIYPLLLELWRSGDLFERRSLKEIIAQAPLKHGFWKALKIIYKEAQERNDHDMFGAIAARLDASLAAKENNHEVRRGTLIYLVRRAWRHLRLLGQYVESVYCQTAVDYLKAYTDQTAWKNTWIANHIFHHESRLYGARSFKSSLNIQDRLRHRAFVELWQRSPEPLLRLLEEAQSKVARDFAVNSLKKEHSISLREIPVSTVLRLLQLQQNEVDAFCVWIFDTVPRFEQARLRELGLHEAVLGLFRSGSIKAQQFAAAYARSHAKDLPLATLLELVNHPQKEVRELAVSLLGERDPRKAIGLEAWTQLLGTPYGHELAEKALIKHFSAKELSPEWFAAALLNPNAHYFASTQLLKFHKLPELGPDYFIKLFRSEAYKPFAAEFILEQLHRFPIENLEPDFLREALFAPASRQTMITWVETGHLDSTRFGVDFLFSLAYQPDFVASPWIEQQLDAARQAGQSLAPLAFDEALSETIFSWLSDVRKFEPADVGFNRLMQLIERKEARYHDFASRYLIKAFTPADFAPSDETDNTPAADASAQSINLQGQSFMFTGKLKTMTRSEAEKKVTDASGKNASGVTKNLDYLVIGDEGSPFYNAGKKGSKQLKGESLIQDGATLKIISETAFLMMLAGRVKANDAGAVQAGCEILWDYAVRPGSEKDPLRQFALSYIRHHHPKIGPLLTERPVDPGAEIPHTFFSFEQLKPLFSDKRPLLVDFALTIARYEASSWRPAFLELLPLIEHGSPEVKDFFYAALTADADKKHDAYRLPAELIQADAVYRLCESSDDFSRNLGMRLLDLHPALADPAALFLLTESSDRRMRAFAVASIWRSYRERGLSANWSPPTAVTPAETPAETPKDERPALRPGKPKPSPWLAGPQSMQLFLRSMLYEIPPGREKSAKAEKSKRQKVKTLPTSKAKVALVETYRNMALNDRTFAELALPVLTEFMASRGKLEAQACLVAIARIEQKYPELKRGLSA